MQDYYSLIHAVLSYIEAHLNENIRPADLERSMCISYPHLREVFQHSVRQPIGRYVLSRRIANAAYELAHTKRTALDIAVSMGFGNPDTFTRSFSRITGMNPSEFRASGHRVGRKRIAAGIYGPSILKERLTDGSNQKEELKMEKEIKKDSGSCILYGVRKVNYCYEEATPFPACLRTVLNYLGQEIDYCYLMAATGAAFRLRWNPNCWDGGNVDVSVIYENPEEAYVRAFRAAGRSFAFLRREKSDKQDFMDFIRKEIDEGRPVIALGIIGPPEASVITGYRNDGGTLLGWNFFQEMGEFGGGHTIDESGYFVTDYWWENPSTTLLMSVGETEAPWGDTAEILKNALRILKTPSVGSHAGGQEAYKLWAQRLSDDREFSEQMPMPERFDRLMCHNDALTMTSEGRAYAGYYMKHVASEYENAGDPVKAALAKKAAAHFMKEFEISQKIGALSQGKNDETGMLLLFDKSVREQAVALIRDAAREDAAAAEAIGEIV